jgi:hypothetical protein
MGHLREARTDLSTTTKSSSRPKAARILLVSGAIMSSAVERPRICLCCCYCCCYCRCLCSLQLNRKPCCHSERSEEPPHLHLHLRLRLHLHLLLSPCRHPERSEGSRRDHPATTFRIFQPMPFSRLLCLPLPFPYNHPHHLRRLQLHPPPPHFQTHSDTVQSPPEVPLPSAHYPTASPPAGPLPSSACTPG